MSPFSKPPNPAATEGSICVDRERGRYVIVRDGGSRDYVSFDEVVTKVQRYSTELLMDQPPAVERGTVAAYDTMATLQQALKIRHDKTGEVAASELSGLLSGLEGCTVRATTLDGEEREFVVGISDGWMPHHIEIRIGGPAVRADADYKRVLVQGVDY